MSYIKYGIYFVVIILIAILFEQLITFFYDLTIQGMAGELNAYLILVFVWLAVYIIAKIFLDKKIHRRASQFTLWASILHISITLAVFFYNTEPMYLLIFPVILGSFFIMRHRGTPRRLRASFQVTHPLFVDDRGGVCVLRSGEAGFTLLKFFRIEPPFPLKEFLLFLFYEKIECTFEVQQNSAGLCYSLCVITQGRDYDMNFQRCLQQANNLRQFFKREHIKYLDIHDYLNTLKMFYSPYFLYKPSTLDLKGIPIQFATLSSFEQAIVVESGFEECNLSIHSLHPSFQPNPLYQFIQTIDDHFYLQLHLSPLDEKQIALREDELNFKYKESLRRLTMGLEENSEFQAASYLFNQVGETSRENIEPLLDRGELDIFNTIKRKLQQIKDGRVIGLWEFECYLACNTTLTQIVSVKLGGTAQVIPPQGLIPLTCRSSLNDKQVIDSRELSTMLPKMEVKVENPLQIQQNY